MKRAWDFTQVVGGLVLLGILAVGLITMFQAARGGAPAPALQVTAQTTEGYPPLPEGTSVPRGYPLPTPAPTLSPPEMTATWGTWIAEATASVPAATPTPLIDSQIISDPTGQFTLTLLSGWNAWVGGVTTIVNYESENLGGEGDFPPGGIKVQMGIGNLAPDQSFEQWQADQIVRDTSPNPEDGWPGQTATEPLPYTLGGYQGFSYSLSGPPPILVINLQLNDGRVINLSLIPADSSALEEALSMLSTLEISSEPPLSD